MPGFRSLATGGDGATAVYNGAMQAHALADEAGHAMAVAKYGMCASPLASDFGRAIASGEAPPTEYGKVDSGEDFADCVRLYFTDRAKLRTQAPLRYKVIKQLMEDDGYGG